MNSAGIVVTGASGGIGRAIACRLASTMRGGTMVLHYARNLAGVEATAARIRDASEVSVSIVQADLAESSDVARLADEAFAAAGVIQTWVNNAGADVLTGTAKDWSFERKLRHLMDVDVLGTFALSRHVGTRLAEQSGLDHVPSMIFIGWDQAATDGGMEGDAGMMFGPVKSAVMSFAAGLAQTLAPRVRVNTIAPGWIQTAWGETVEGYWDDRARSQALMNRWGRPDDVASAAAYLADPANDFVTGQTLNINGGWNRRFVAT